MVFSGKPGSADKPSVRVTGATGYIGGRLVPALEAQGVRLRCLALWLGLVTPVYARVGRELIDGLKDRSVVTDPMELAVFPIGPVGLRDAISRAIRYEDRAFALTRWSDARSSAGGDSVAGRRAIRWQVDRRTPGPRWRSMRTALVPIARIGGSAAGILARGCGGSGAPSTLPMGGVGLRRGRRDPEVPAVGDTLDFWRVEAYEPGRRLRLAAEMKVPGRAWLEFEIVPVADGAVVHQTAVFEPIGLPGLLYWYVLLPVHALIFAGLLRAIVRRAGEDADRHRAGAGASS